MDDAIDGALADARKRAQRIANSYGEQLGKDAIEHNVDRSQSG